MDFVIGALWRYVMVNGIDLVSFFITFGVGFIIGGFFGIMLMSLMVAS